MPDKAEQEAEREQKAASVWFISLFLRVSSILLEDPLTAAMLIMRYVSKVLTSSWEMFRQVYVYLMSTGRAKIGGLWIELDASPWEHNSTSCKHSTVATVRGSRQCCEEIRWNPSPVPNQWTVYLICGFLHRMMCELHLKMYTQYAFIPTSHKNIPSTSR